jgi:SAM-dependent methyltransferase
VSEGSGPTGTVDFGRTADDYARYRAGFPEVLFERLERTPGPCRDLDVLDLGTGTGTLALGFAARGARVTGLDPATELLARAEAAAGARGLEVRWIEGRAEAPPLPAASFDRVVAGQCWHWFDGPAAAAAARRLLRPGGLLLMAHFDWLPRPGSVVEATEALILAHNPAWAPFAGGNGFHTAWHRDLEAAGFRGLEGFFLDVDVSYPAEAWRGRIRASAGVSASLAPEAVEAFDREHGALLAERFPDAELSAPHRLFAIWGAAPTP